MMNSRVIVACSVLATTGVVALSVYFGRPDASDVASAVVSSNDSGNGDGRPATSRAMAAARHADWEAHPDQELELSARHAEWEALPLRERRARLVRCRARPMPRGPCLLAGVGAGAP